MDAMENRDKQTIDDAEDFRLACLSSGAEPLGVIPNDATLPTLEEIFMRPGALEIGGKEVLAVLEDMK